MDYLHGHVIDGDFEAACFYEYGRESKTLRYAAKLRKRFIRKADWGYVKDGDREIPHPANLDEAVAQRTSTRFGIDDPGALAFGGVVCSMAVAGDMAMFFLSSSALFCRTTRVRAPMRATLVKKWPEGPELDFIKAARRK